MKGQRKPLLGQHFLVDTDAKNRIVSALGSCANRTVLEIGPGKGALTEQLAERASRLIAVELDPALASVLRVRFAAEQNVEVLEADILTFPFEQFADTRELAVIGNLPYYITSPILHRLFAYEHLISRAVLMVQREVAERLSARPGTSSYGLLSVLSQIHTQVELLFALAPTAFAPPPKVDSAVLRMEFRPQWAELGVEPVQFTKFLGRCFAQKRKTLINNLRAAGYPGKQVTLALSIAETAPTARAEELAPHQLATVFRSLQAE